MAGHKNTCNFSHISECAGNVVLIGTFENANVILSEVGLILNTHTINYRICDNHYIEFKNRNIKRSRKKLCCVPELISRHDGQHTKAYRNLNSTQVVDIHQATGVVVPIATRK